MIHHWAAGFLPRRIPKAAICGALFLIAPAVLRAGDAPPCETAPGGGRAAKVTSIPTWLLPAEPFHLFGPVFFVGTKGLGVWLIETSEGLILMNTGVGGSHRCIVRALHKLKKDPKRIRLLLACHAHVDHVGGHAAMKRLTGARIAMMKQEVSLLASGGALDFWPVGRVFGFAPVATDWFLGDGEKIPLGDVTITALHTPGHTRGATTFVMTFIEAGRTYKVVFPDGTGINPFYRLTGRESYPGIRRDYESTLARLAELKPDIWLSPHLEVCDFWEKRKRSKTEGIAAWVDPVGYCAFLCRERKALSARIRDEQVH